MENGGLHSSDIKGGFGVGLWNEIRKEWSLFLQHVAFSLGDGRGQAFGRTCVVVRKH